MWSSRHELFTTSNGQQINAVELRVAPNPGVEELPKLIGASFYPGPGVENLPNIAVQWFD